MITRELKHGGAKMSKEDVAEECGYEKVKGTRILAREQHGKSDIFVKESELKGYWYNEESGLAYENTEEGLNRLCDDEQKSREKA